MLRPLPRSFWVFLPILLLPTAFLTWVAIRLDIWWAVVVYVVVGAGSAVRAVRVRQAPSSPSGRPVASVDVTDRAVVLHIAFPGPLRHRKDVAIPFASITSIRSDADASSQPPGWCRSLSGVANRRYSVGMFIPMSGKVWRALYAVRRGMPAVVIDLHSDNFQRVIFEAADPDAVAAMLRAAVSASAQQV